MWCDPPPVGGPRGSAGAWRGAARARCAGSVAVRARVVAGALRAWLRGVRGGGCSRQLMARTSTWTCDADGARGWRGPALGGLCGRVVPKPIDVASASDFGAIHVHAVRALRTAAVEGTQQTRALERRALKRFWYIHQGRHQLSMGVQAECIHVCQTVSPM